MVRRASILAVVLAACGGAGSGGDDDDDDDTTDAAPADARTEPLSRVEQYIRGDDFSRLVIEVDAVSGFEPRPAVEANIAAGFAPLLDKPDGVEVVRDGAIPSRGSDHGWTFDELTQLADDHFDLEVDASTIKIGVLFLDGHWHEDGAGGSVLGLAWSNRHIAMFKQTIENLCGGVQIPPLLRDQLCAGAEESIWTHEIGHVLGLVDNGLPMVTPHRDPDHGAHDENDACVMYWAYENDEVITTLRDQLVGGGDATLDFDQACLDDIAAVRDGG